MVELIFTIVGSAVLVGAFALVVVGIGAIAVCWDEHRPRH